MKAPVIPMQVERLIEVRAPRTFRESGKTLSRMVLESLGNHYKVHDGIYLWPRFCKIDGPEHVMLGFQLVFNEIPRFQASGSERGITEKANQILDELIQTGKVPTAET